MSTHPTYIVTDWADLYETSETKKYKTLSWVPIPNKHDGLTYGRMTQQRNAPELFAAWCAILQVASKTPQPKRGWLIRGDEPMTSADLAVMTRLPKRIFDDAFAFFSEKSNAWLTVVEPKTPALAASSTQVVESDPAQPALIHATMKNHEKHQQNSTSAVTTGESAVTTEDSDVTPARIEENRIEEKELLCRDKSRRIEVRTHARVAIVFLNKLTGSRFQEREPALRIIEARLAEPGVDIEGVKLMLRRQVAKWQHDPKMREYLRPETLFNATKFGSYYAAREMPVENGHKPARAADVGRREMHQEMEVHAFQVPGIKQ